MSLSDILGLNIFEKKKELKEYPYTPEQLASLQGTPDKDFSQHMSMEQPPKEESVIEQIMSSGQGEKRTSTEADAPEEKRQTTESVEDRVAYEKEQALLNMKAGSKGKKDKGDKKGPGFMDKYGSKIGKGLNAAKDALLKGLEGQQEQYEYTEESQRGSLDSVIESSKEASRQKTEALASMQGGFLQALQRGRK